MPFARRDTDLDRSQAGYLAMASVAETPRSSCIGTFLSMGLSGGGSQWMS